MYNGQSKVASFCVNVYCRNNCSNRSLLAQCGDIETNPGPGPGPGPGQGHQAAADDQRDQRGDGGDDAVRDQQDTGEVRKRPVRCELQVLTFNIRGLSDPKKVRHIVNRCHKESKSADNSFFMFQETFVTNLDILKYIWRGEYHLTPGLGNSKGCLTLVTAPFKIIYTRDLESRAHIIVLTKSNLDQAEVILVNVYAPNGFDDVKIRFFETLVENISEIVTTYGCSNVVLAGDLNIVFTELEIKNRAYSNAEKRAATAIKEQLAILNLEDSWNYAEERQFTWSSTRTGVPAFSTLDRVLCTKDKFRVMHINSDWSLSLSDHAAVTAGLNMKPITRNTKTSHISRLDPRLLLDPEGRLHLDARFRELVDQEVQGWNPHVRLEYYKMCIRTASNDAIGKVKAKLRDTEADLNVNINEVVGELASDRLAVDRKALLMNKLDDLRQLKRSLVEKIGTKLEQRTARKWYNEGELSNKYFFNLLNRRTNDEVTSILDNGIEICEDKLIKEKIQTFYKDLYEKVPDDVDANNDAFLFRHVEKVSQDGSARMSDDLTLEELKQTLNTCSDSAPGPDGIPYSFLKHFWTDFGPVLLDSWRHSLRSGDLPPSHKISYLRLIPKVGKDTRVIANLRPITLSNTDHKLITKTYAKKLTEVVSNCISEEQTAYIPGRLINDNVRSMLMTIDLADVDANVDGVVVSLDARKAFDSVDHGYIRRCLKAFGLESFIAIFNVLYKDLRSSIILNGQIIDGYSILKGVKQGDALSCVIFIMCMEPLLRNIKQNAIICPIASIALPIRIPKVYSFADDITAIAINENQGVQEIFNEYNAFSNASGLQLNADKTEILCFGRRRGRPQVFNVTYNGANYGITSKDSIKINGVVIQQDSNRREDINVEASIVAMERLLRSWSTRRLTLLGRILIIKTFAMSKMIYLMQTMSLSERSYKAFVRVVFKFLWNRNFDAARAPERIKRNIMNTPVNLGGFGMVDIRAMGDSLDLKSYGRLITTKHPFMSQVRERMKAEDFFNVKFNDHVDVKAKRSLILLREERQKIQQWPSDILLRDLNFRWMLSNHKVNELLTAAGKQSIPYLSIHRRLPRARIRNITQVEFTSIERYLKYPLIAPMVRTLLALPINLTNIPGNIATEEIFPLKDQRLVKVSALSSKQLRLNRVQEEDQLICIYKLGPILTPGEVMSWTSRTKKLTSTRHKNILLRAMHGDIFSNERLTRFGLRQDSRCSNCPELYENRIHKLKDCPSANAAWLELEKAKLELGLRNLTDLSIENLIGAKDELSKIELALQAELIHKLTSRKERYCPKGLVRSVIKLIGYSERLSIELKIKFDEWLRV